MLILASNSPRRRQLLSLLGIPFEVKAAEVDETPLSGELPEAYVNRLAVIKAQAAAIITPPEAFILAADTTVAAELEGKPVLLGKPKDAADAKFILEMLKGKHHSVFTSLALLHPQTGKLWQDSCHTTIFMRMYSDNEIASYIASGDPFDKAGAYAIQHTGFHPVERLDGCYANVMGLPVCHTARLLRTAGIRIPPNPAIACEIYSQQFCPISANIYPYNS